MWGKINSNMQITYIQRYKWHYFLQLKTYDREYYLSLSNMPIISRHVSALKGDQFPFMRACWSSAAVILPEWSVSTACRAETLQFYQSHIKESLQFYRSHIKESLQFYQSHIKELLGQPGEEYLKKRWREVIQNNQLYNMPSQLGYIIKVGWRLRRWEGEER